jgi:tRNA(fMet)-specific endonuclease VapC
VDLLDTNILDNNICIAINNQNPQAIAQFSRKYAQCYVPTIVIAELYKGAYCSQKRELNINRINDFLSLIPTIVEFDRPGSSGIWENSRRIETIGKTYGRLRCSDCGDRPIAP